MSAGRESPLVARNFRVRIGLRGPRGGSAGERELAFSQVVFPPFRVGGRMVRDNPDDGDARGPEESTNLVLRRGHTGSPELYQWWRAERDGERVRVRDVVVVLLGEDHRPVTAWHFTGCHIVSLCYSPLDALESGPLLESLEVAFKRVEQTVVDA